jgi:hypothetical protein
MALPDEVADLLTRSMFFHRNALVLRNRHLIGALIALIKARDLRKDANSLDPTFTAPAWKDERKAFYPGINEALLLFYGRLIP